MAAVLGLPLCGVASAQTAVGVSNARVQAVHAEWRKLSQTEVNCIDRSLRARKTAIWFLIERGIAPTDASVAGARAACRVSAQAQTKPAAGHAALAEAPPPESVAVQATPAKVVPDMAEGEKITVKPEDAAAQKAAAAQAAAEKAAADKARAEKAAAEKAAADKAAAAKAAMEKYVFEKSAVDKTSVDRTALELAKAETERARAEAATAMAQAERARKDAEKAIADAGFALAAAESKVSFIYGLASGPALAGLGVAVFLVIRRKKKPFEQPAAA
jgi:hypothetical protein